MLFEIVGCGEARTLTSVVKTLGDDDDDALLCCIGIVFNLIR